MKIKAIRKNLFLMLAFSMVLPVTVLADNLNVSSPDGKLVVDIDCTDGSVNYAVKYNNKQMVESSRLGLKADIGDFANGLKLAGSNTRSINENYTMRGTKASAVHYVANELNIDLENQKKQKMIITFRISNNDVAFRYSFPQEGERACMVVKEELTSFRLPSVTTTYICPQSGPMIGWKRTKPSYEEEYTPNAPMAVKSMYGQGYTFPCLFKVDKNGWVLVSETGTNGNYAGCHLSDYNATNGYQIAFPMAGEANGWGSAESAMTLPGETPWRTITVGEDLKPIVETTVAYDVVEPQYKASEDYKPGRYTWSWLVWQDNSVNYNDQVKFIDTAAEMGYEYCLVDGLWDKQIGRKRMEELSRYAQSKGVHLLLWYNSNGFENDAPQTPKNCMNTSINRKREMAWLKSIGVKGIKVDFFGGDKQHTMQLYEDILSDANDYGIQVIFHGCTLPRGWERMYPNFVASEAVLASENTYFTDHHAKKEGFELTMHPFCRNTVASMDWGGTIMNHYMSKDNKSRHRRYTSDVFEMAASIVNQSSVQCIAIQPNNLNELPKLELDWLKTVPTTWDETRYIAGEPGRYVVLARRSGNRWYVAGLNATGAPLKLELSLPMFKGQQLDCYTDKAVKGSLWPETILRKVKVGNTGKLKVELLDNGGLILN